MVLESLKGPFIFISLSSHGRSTEISKSLIPATYSPPLSLIQVCLLLTHHYLRLKKSAKTPLQRGILKDNSNEEFVCIGCYHRVFVEAGQARNA